MVPKNKQITPDEPPLDAIACREYHEGSDTSRIGVTSSQRFTMNSDAASPPGEPENQTEVGTNGADRSAVPDAQTPDSTPRWHQIFPVLTDAEIDQIHRFGAIHSYATGEFLYRAGGMSPGMFVLLSGTIRYTARDGLGHRRLLRSQAKRGEFTSDVGMLSGKPGLVDAEVI